MAVAAPGGVGYTDSAYVGGTAIDAHATIAVVRRAGNFSSFVRGIVTVGNTAIQVHNNNDLFYVANAGATAFVAPITTTLDWHVVVFRRRNPTVEIFVSRLGQAAFNYASVGGASSARNWVPSGNVRVGCVTTGGEHPHGAAALVYSLVGDVSDALIRECLRNPWRIFEPRRIIVPVSAGAGNTIAVPAGSLTLTGFAPTVTATANQVVEVPAGTLTLAGQTPTVTSGANQTISVPAGTLTLTANAPTVTASENQSISVPAGALTLTGFEPSVLNGAQQVVQVPLGTLTLTGQTPTVAVSANQVIEVPAGTLTLAGQTPTVVATNPQLISVPLGTLTLTGLVPTISNVGVNNQISVPLGTLTMSGGTPVVRVSSDADVFIDRFAARSRITQSLRFGSRITTQVGLRSSLKD